MVPVLTLGKAMILITKFPEASERFHTYPLRKEIRKFSIQMYLNISIGISMLAGQGF